MPRTQRPRQHRTPPASELAWRETRIRDWRKHAGLTQQDVADALERRGIELTRESIQRIERGKQRPLITAIEAMAELFDTDVTTMLNLTPEEADKIRKFNDDVKSLLERFPERKLGG